MSQGEMNEENVKYWHYRIRYFRKNFEIQGGGKSENLKYKLYEFFDYLIESAISKNIYLDKNFAKIGQLQPEILNFQIFTDFRTEKYKRNSSAHIMKTVNFRALVLLGLLIYVEKQGEINGQNH